MHSLAGALCVLQVEACAIPQAADYLLLTTYYLLQVEACAIPQAAERRAAQPASDDLLSEEIPSLLDLTG